MNFSKKDHNIFGDPRNKILRGIEFCMYLIKKLEKDINTEEVEKNSLEFKKYFIKNRRAFSRFSSKKHLGLQVWLLKTIESIEKLNPR